MPCYSITQVQLLLEKANVDLLKKALEGLGYLGLHKDGEKRLYWNGGMYNKDSGKLTVREDNRVSEIKKAYSAEVVKAQAKRFGWQLKETGQYKYQIIKR
jgi:nitrate reductase beta subunit